MNVCILSDGASCTVTLQKHSHPWSSCNDPEVIATAKFASFRLEKVRRQRRWSIQKKPSSFLIPIIPISSPTCPFIFHSPPTKSTPTYPNHPHHPFNPSPRYSLAVSIVLTAPVVLEEAAVPGVHPQFQEFIQVGGFITTLGPKMCLSKPGGG